MLKTLHSNTITFVDYTDSRKLEAYITSNLPTMQIYDTNNQTYSPDWSVTNLQLSADIYLDSQEVTNNTATSIIWYKKIGIQPKIQVGTGINLTVDSNQLVGANSIITYICEAIYNDAAENSPIAHTEIIFTRIDTGMNGIDGVDGVGVTILGSYNTLEELQTAHPIGNAGDAYIIGGNLYVWSVDNAQWEDVGNIQGPAGANGKDAKSIILAGSSQVFKVSKTNEVTPSTIQVTAYTFNTTAADWTYSIDGGQTFLIAEPAGISRNGNIVTVTGSNITSDSVIIKASDGEVEDIFTVYRALDGADGISTPIAFLTNENVTFSANAQGQISGTTIKSNVVAYNGTTKVLPTIGTITDVPTGMTIIPGVITESNEIMLTITIDNNSTLGSASNNMGVINIPITSPINTTLSLTWSKVNAGNTGAGIKSTTVTYGVSNSASTRPSDNSWQSTLPIVAEGEYLWTRTIIDYTDDAVADTVTYTYAKQGEKGNTGSSGTSVTVSSIQYQSGTSATTAPTGTWSNSVVAVAEGSFLWTKTTFSDGKVAYGVAKQGISGSDAYTVMLTNESHIFAGDVSNAIAGSATTQVMAYKGSTAQSVTITSVNGKTASLTDTDTGIAGLKFKCSALSGATPTITFTCTTSFVSPNGAIPIVISVGGISFTKMFTYSIAFKGTTGNPGTPASLVDITPSAYYFKSTTGKDGIFTPDYIYLYPRFQNATYNGWQYSLDGGSTWTAVTNANGLSVGTYGSVNNTLRVSRTSVLYTDTITSISFRCNSLTSGVYDTVSIAKIYDVVDLNIGGRNLLYDSTFNVGTTWPKNYGSILPPEADKPNSSIYHVSHTNNGTATIGTPIYNSKRTYVSLKAGDTITVSYDFYTDNLDLIGDHVTTLRYSTAATGGTITSLYSNTKPHLVDAGLVAGKWQRFSYTYTATSDIDGWLIFGLYIRAEIGKTVSYKFREIKIERGNKATDWIPSLEEMVSVSFQLYAPKGYLITYDVPEVTLQTFAYDGSQPITSATFKWYHWVNEEWVVVNEATGTSLTLTKSDVLKSGTYKCEMTYRGTVYTATETVEDKTDIYESLIRVNAKRTSDNDMYWVLYATVYSEEGEKDALLGPISEIAPASPTSGTYWYQINPSDYSVTLKKYSGTAWANSTDQQELFYDWFLFKDTTDMVSLGDKSKVKIIKSGDFTNTCNVQCNIFDAENTVLSRNNQVLNDPTDPVVSDTAPTNPINGQIWIKVESNGSYVLSVWSAEQSKWIVSNADTQNKIYVTKPTQYNAGDLWIVDSNYLPVAYENEVAQSYKHPEKTMLRAIATSSTYSDAHWVEALKYQEELNEVITDVNKFKQFLSVDSTGLTMQAKNANGTVSEFKTMLTNTELGFYQGDVRVAYINNNQLNISKAQITNGLSIGGTTPMLELGNFVLIQEANGSLSIG